MKVKGRGELILCEKLKRLKERLRTWNNEVFGWIDLKVNGEVGKINELDKSLVENFGNNVDSFVAARREASSEFWKYLLTKENMLILKSRQLWLMDGDKNTRYFHNSIKAMYRRNAISVMEGRNGRVEGMKR